MACEPFKAAIASTVPVAYIAGVFPDRGVAL